MLNITPKGIQIVRQCFIQSILLLFTFQVQCLEFNSNQVINLTKTGLELSEGEGYLLLSLENNKKIADIVIKSEMFTNKIKFNDIPKGQNFALLKVKAGNYSWSSVVYHLGRTVTFNYKKDEKEFIVEPGVINYPGSWEAEMEITTRQSVILYLSTKNKSAYELKKLRNKHSEIYKNHEFRFQGEVKDHYSKHFKQVSLQAQTSVELPGIKLNKLTDFERKDGVYDETHAYKYLLYYLQEYNQSIGNFSPDGKFLVFQAEDKGVTRIIVLNLSNFEMTPILQKQLPKNSGIDEIKWIDNDSIYYNVLYDGRYNRRVAHLKISPKNGLVIGAKHLKIPTHGALIGALKNTENTIYMAKIVSNSKRKNGIYKINTSSDKTIKKSLKKPFKVIKELENSIYGLTDSAGIIRFIITSEYNKKEDLSTFDYWFLPLGNKKFEKIYSHQSDADYQFPLLISKDLKELYVITNKYGDKKSIHSFSTIDYSHQGVFYENDEFDINGIEFDSLHNIIGIRYVEGGFNKIEYFEDEDDLLAPMKNKFPDHKFYVAQHHIKTNNVLVYGTSEFTKGSWSIFNTKTEEINKLFELNPNYSRLEKGTFQTVTIKTDDNIDVEGYLVTPNNEATKHPLIVMPHGGPIGVRDYASNSDIQHFFASQGYATLKVNYRGSIGFGKKFLESGKKQWGNKIESDINQMVDHVIDNFNISEKNICAMGASYGGYSAVMLSILYPGRYKCAVSHAGVMDLPLMFTSSDFRHNDKTVEAFKNIVGDPAKEYKTLIEKSPVYIANKITKPILLFHGAKDKRVTFEHSRRMKEILDMLNKQSDLIVFTTEGHSFNDLESKIVYVARSLDFIKESLKNTNE
ncbi:MAG: prolyl oligopeptidase family serine peptidase [Marinicellaceae bacterium]